METRAISRSRKQQGPGRKPKDKSEIEIIFPAPAQVLTRKDQAEPHNERSFGLRKVFPMSQECDSHHAIMVVDDHEGNREVLNLFLSAGGYHVIEAANGLEAVKIAASRHLDLIIMDLAMPVMDGFAAVGLLRQASETRDLPIIAYTANVTETNLKRAQALGFNEFLIKPIDFRKLNSMLSRFLNVR